MKVRICCLYLFPYCWWLLASLPLQQYGSVLSQNNLT
jgi:hypothetical protein